MECPSVGVRTVSISEDNEGQQMGNVEWERPNRSNRHYSIKLYTLHIKCPSVGVRTVSTAVDRDGGLQGVMEH